MFMAWLICKERYELSQESRIIMLVFLFKVHLAIACRKKEGFMFKQSSAYVQRHLFGIKLINTLSITWRPYLVRLLK